MKQYVLDFDGTLFLVLDQNKQIRFRTNSGELAIKVADKLNGDL